MRQTRRGFIVAAVGLAGVMAGCGGGGGGERNRSVSGRFVRQDVTPANLSRFTVSAVSTTGIVSAGVYQGSNQEDTQPVVIDLEQRTVTGIAYDGPEASEPLRYGQGTAVSAQGDVYGTFRGATDASASPLPGADSTYSFVYTRATGKTTVRPYTFSISGGVSNIGEVLQPDNRGTAIVRYDFPDVKRPFYFQGGGDSRGYYINASGTIVGGYGTEPLYGPTFLFVSKDGVASRLPPLTAYPRAVALPLALGDDDRVVGSLFVGDTEVRIVTWQGGEPVLLPATPVPLESVSVLGMNTRGEFLLDSTRRTDADADRPTYHHTYLLWRDSTGAWLDVTADVTADNAKPIGLLADGRLVTATSTKLYTLTPR